MTVLIPNLAIAGYRSFGKSTQYFDRFAKINIFIGQNNSGKSNVLRFVHDIYSKIGGREAINLDALAQHMPDRPPMLLGIGESLEGIDTNSPCLPDAHRLVSAFRNTNHQGVAAQVLAKVLMEKARLDGTRMCWTLMTIPACKNEQDTWLKATKSIGDDDIYKTWRVITGYEGGDRNYSWVPDVAQRLMAAPVKVRSQLIPAIRQIGVKGSISEEFDGTGIIERIAKLQNPDIHSQEDRTRFNAIQDFLRDVIDRPDATIEVPYERDTILVHMNGRVLPIESLGSGIHEVLILASAATVLENHVVCIEEPELHLNPILQKKLLRYLSDRTNNQYFITTHSAALMDTPKAEVYHVRFSESGSLVERTTSNEDRSAICEDLGYHPSDLLQANCVIWVEGPSDRIYLNWWIADFDPSLIEGIHYSVMFYGGRLASHLSNAPDSEEVDNFISLRRLNRRGVIVIDSDRRGARCPINATKRRLQAEFDSGPGHAWITEGREIENYLMPSDLRAAIATIHPTAKYASAQSKYDSVLSMISVREKGTTASKVDIARHISQKCKPDLSMLDLRKRIQALLKFINDSNPKTVTRASAP